MDKGRGECALGDTSVKGAYAYGIASERHVHEEHAHEGYAHADHARESCMDA